MVNYRLHDWCISRQRYWGPPIPIIYCDACGAVPVPEKDLPVVLPRRRGLQARRLRHLAARARTRSGIACRARSAASTARRETDVSDTFLDSAWYFLRYPSADRDDVPFDRGAHEASGCRWTRTSAATSTRCCTCCTRASSRWCCTTSGYIDFEEPFTKFRAHGLIISDGAKMSKSKRQRRRSPTSIIEQWGADTFRTYLMFLGPFEEGGDFRDQGIAGVRRFLDRLWASVLDATTDGAPDPDVDAQAAPDDPARSTDDIPTLELQHGDRGDDGVPERRCARGERTPHRAEVEPLVQLRRAVRAAHRRRAVGAARAQRRACSTPAGRRSTPRSRPTIGDSRGAGERQDARNDSGRADLSEDEALAAAMADPAIAKFVTGAPKKVIFVPGGC